ncbi:MAG: hypothetical protein JW825_00815 [Candidatus Methanofastidiosa archaeon]|nr:hypothetical protein [Candidatus Methanofastidiosa archaeon]
MNIKREMYLWSSSTLLMLVTIEGIILFQDWSSTEKIGMMLSAMLAILAFSGFGWLVKERFKDKSKGIPFSDERTEKIEGKVFKYSFLSAFWISIILTWINIILRYLERDQMPSDISLVAVLVAMFLFWSFYQYRFSSRNGL